MQVKAGAASGSPRCESVTRPVLVVIELRAAGQALVVVMRGQYIDDPCSRSDDADVGKRCSVRLAFVIAGLPGFLGQARVARPLSVREYSIVSAGRGGDDSNTTVQRHCR